uniref:Uncharacterized protein n=1 Tax=Manihot esculenta TaxID=3983 RepID=A0A2C9W232_MANES
MIDSFPVIWVFELGYRVGLLDFSLSAFEILLFS